MRIFVTGGAGFIGSAFVRHVLASSDDHVTVFDSLTYAGSTDNLAGLDPARVTFVHGDVTDEAAVQAAMTGHGAVVHLAAETHVDRSHRRPDAFDRTNRVGTDVVCRSARAAGVERFLHASTDEVYGSTGEGVASEDAELRPTSPYASSKVDAEAAVRAHVRDGLPAVITRASNQYGPRQYPEKLIPRFTTALLSGDTVPLYGDGLHVRDWLHVDDGCAALDLVLRHGTVGATYNVSGHQERTNLDVTERLLAILHLDRSRIVQVEDRPDHDRRYAIDAARIEQLGFHPTRWFDDELEQTVAWYRANEGWWRPRVEALAAGT